MRRLLAPLALLLAMGGCHAPHPAFDLIVRGGQVYDGLAPVPAQVDIGIRGDRITAMGDLSSARASREVLATGVAVAPGFIDLQSLSSLTLLVDGIGESHLRQGVTSHIVSDDAGPAFWNADTADAESLRPFGVSFDWTGFEGYLERLQQRGTAANVGLFVPLVRVNGPGELAEAMRRGALGVSVTRGATPGTEATLAELQAAADVVAAADGVLAIQLEGDSANVLRMFDEVAQITRDSNARLILFQPSIVDDEAGTLNALVARVRQARTSGAIILTTAAPDVSGAGTWFAESGASVGSRAAATPTARIFGRHDAQPRAFHAFAHVIAQYVREEGVVSLGEAIRRMTSNAANALRLDGRGVLRVGAVADIVVFDPVAIRVTATAESSQQYATGIQHVIVGGVPVLDPNGLTGARPGRTLVGRALTQQPTQ